MLCNWKFGRGIKKTVTRVALFYFRLFCWTRHSRQADNVVQPNQDDVVQLNQDNVVQFEAHLGEQDYDSLGRYVSGVLKEI